MDDAPDEARASAVSYDVEATGAEHVDAVLAEVSGLSDRPVAEHVAVFERAHEQLRRALDAAPPATDERGV